MYLFFILITVYPLFTPLSLPQPTLFLVLQFTPPISVSERASLPLLATADMEAELAISCDQIDPLPNSH